VRIGKPSVQGEQRHLYRERNHECDEEPPSLGDAEATRLDDAHDIKREFTRAFSSKKRRGDDPDEQKR